MEILKKIISWLLVFIIGMSAIFLTVSSLIRMNLKEEKIINSIKENDLTFILQKKNGETNDLMKDTKEYLKKIGIPKEAMDAVVNSGATKEFVGNYMYKVLKLIIYQEGSVAITKNEIQALVKNNFPIIEESLKKEGKNFTKEQQEEILSLIDIHSDQIMELFPTVKTLIQKLDTDSFMIYDSFSLKDFRNIVASFTSKTMILSLISVLFCSAILLVLIHFKKICSLKYIRISILIYIFFFIFIEIILGTIVKDYLMSGWESANAFLNYFVNFASKSLWLFLITSIVLVLIISIILKKFQEKKIAIDNISLE